MINARRVLKFEEIFLLKNPDNNIYTNPEYLNDPTTQFELLQFFGFRPKDYPKQNYSMLKKEVKKYIGLVNILNVEEEILEKNDLLIIGVQNKIKFYIQKRLQKLNDKKSKELIECQIFNEKNWNDEQKFEFITFINIQINKYLEIMNKNKIEFAT